MEKYTYSGRDGFAVTLRPIVPGQLARLINVLRAAGASSASLDVELFMALGERLPAALAAILCDAQGMPVRDKSTYAEFAGHVEWDLDGGTVARIIADFFELNPISSWLESAGLTLSLPSTSTQHSTGSSATSQEETSCGMTTSSGE